MRINIVPLPHTDFPPFEPQDNGWLLARRANGDVEWFPWWGASDVLAFKYGMLRKYEPRPGDCVWLVVAESFADVTPEIAELRAGRLPCVPAPETLAHVRRGIMEYFAKPPDE